MFSNRIALTLALTLSAVTLSFSGEAFAHAALKTSSPGNGSIVSAPKTLNLEFEHPAKLMKLKLTGEGKEVPVTVDPSAPAAKNFVIPLPALAAGKYQVKWATLGSDGHAMTGGFSFEVSGK